jgi:serine/threonine protein kinase
MTRFDHPNIIKFKDAYTNVSEKYCIVMEYASGIGLYDIQVVHCMIEFIEIVAWTCLRQRLYNGCVNFV